MQRIAFLAFLSICIHSVSAGAETAAASPNAAAEPPRLLVLIVVDQLGRGLLAHHETHLVGGLRRLVDRGRRFANAVVDHAPSNSLPGHLTAASGAYPRRHGLVDNSWVEVGTPTHERVTGFVDSACRALGPNGQASERRRAIGPGRFEAPTLVEWALAANSAARFASVGTGEGVSALHAGHARGPVLWYEAADGGYISSTCFGPSLPGWAIGFNARLRQDFMSQDWLLTAPPAMTAGLVDDEAFENRGEDRTFPHRRPGAPDEVASWFVNTPLADAATLRLAELAVREEGLGADAVTDVLTIGLSTIDHVGHRFGPYSVEQADTLHRLDVALGRFFAFLDTQVGEGRWTVALTADHGAPPPPEMARRQGVRSARRVTEQQAHAAIATIAAAAGQTDTPADRTRATAQAAERLDFVERVLVADRIEALAAAGDPIARLYANSYRPGRVSLHPLYDDPQDRSPADYGLLLVTRPYTVVDWAASIHGSPHDYDRQVVMLFYGAGVTAANVAEAARTIDVAPTLGSVAGIAPLRPIDGRPLDLTGR